VLGLTALSVATCISSPIAGLLCVNLPVANLCNLARRHGAMLSGYEAVEKLSNTNAVMIDSTDLFPKNSISLGDIRIYGGGKQIDQSIRNAAAVMSNTGGTLRDLFEGVISSQKEMLPKATSIAYVENQGMSGIVNGKRVLVGNRTMMEQNNIALPNDSRQVKLKSNERVIFLAEDNRPMAMLTVTYDPDPSTVHEMQRLESCGIAAIVRTLDPNLTSDFLSTLFLVEENAIKVLPDELGACCDRVLQRETDACDALLATRGKSFSMMRMLSACVRQKHNIALAVTMQIVSIILGFVLVSFLSCYAGLQQLSTIAILIYELVWLAAIIIIPKLRKP
jgi:cation transport ATPase